MIEIKHGFEKTRSIRRLTIGTMREVVYAIICHGLLCLLFPN